MLLYKTSTAQLPKYYVQKLQESGGLNTTDIVSLTKDKLGYLWIATQFKVQKFDGINCINYSFQEQIDHIYCDNNNNIWVLSKGLLYRFNKQNNRFDNFKLKSSETAQIQAIFEFDNAVHFISNNNIYRYHQQNDSTNLIFNTVFTNIKTSKTVSAIHKQALLLANLDSLYCYDFSLNTKKVIQLKNVESILPINYPYCIVSTNRYQVFLVNITTFEIKNITNKISQTFNTNEGGIVLSATLIAPNKYLLSSTYGFIELNTQTQNYSIPTIYFNGELFSKQHTIAKNYTDAEGNSFFCHANGIFIINNSNAPIQYLRNYTQNGVTLPSNIRDFEEDENGSIWMATTQGIFIVEPERGAVKKLHINLQQSSKNDFVSVRQILLFKHFCFIGTAGNGVYIYNRKTNSNKKIISDKSNPNDNNLSEIDEAYIWKITALNNDSIFIASGKACYVYIVSKNSLNKLSFKTPSYNSRTFYIDSTENYWYGTSNGLAILNKQFKTKQIVESFTDKRIAAFCSLSKDTMLIGSKGLYVASLNANHQYTFQKVKEIPDDFFIYCMEKDANNNIWLGTNNGILKYDYYKKSVDIFNHTNNVQTDVFNSDGAFLSKKGMMYFGGKNGLNYFNPLAVKPLIIVLQPQLISLRYGNHQLNYFDSITSVKIPYNQNNIIIRFSTPNYQTPFSITYKYRLQTNEEWQTADNQTQINISSLKSGNYDLQIASSINGKDWFYNKNILAIQVLKPWWQSLWFYAIIIIIVIIAACLFLLWRKDQHENNQIENAIEYFSNSRFEQNSLQDILWDITSNCVARLGLQECVIYIVHKETNTLHQRAAFGKKNSMQNHVHNPLIIDIGKGIVGAVAATATAEIVHNTTKDKRYIVDDENRLSEITVPIIYENEVIGIIDSEHPKAHFFKPKHLKALTTIATICSAKISKSITKEKLDEVTQKVEILNHQLKEMTFLNLRLQMNPHFLFNSLTSIQHLIISQQTNEAYKYLTIFSNFLRSILKFAEQTYISLEEEIKLLRMYISLESLGFNEPLHYSITISDDIEEEEIAIPPLLIQPFIENAIWHGLKNKKGDKYFSVTFNLIDETTVCCSIYDNGIGRKKHAESVENKFLNNTHKSKATQLAKQRLLLIQEQTNKKAYLEIIDEVEGTRVNIYFPYTYYNFV